MLTNVRRYLRRLRNAGIRARMSTMSTRANKELIRTLVDEAFNRHDLDAIDRAFAGRCPRTTKSS